MLDPKVREVVLDELGFEELDDDYILNAIYTHKDASTSDLEEMLKEKEGQLRSAGGRGVELAEEVDEIRAAIAARSVK